MPADPLPELTYISQASRRARLAFKKEFIRYYAVVSSPAIADPTDVYRSLERYLAGRRDDVGRPLDLEQLADELDAVMGEVAQDIRLDRSSRIELQENDSLPERFWECVEVVTEHRLERLLNLCTIPAPDPSLSEPTRLTLEDHP